MNDNRKTSRKIIAIHGAGMDGRVWDGLAAHLIAQMQGLSVESLSLPGHGEDRVAPLLSIEDMAAWVTRKIGSPCILVGHSMGGLVVRGATNHATVSGQTWQHLVRDVISGFFLILEDQVRIGDLARVNGVAGTVEQINLRTIVVRDMEGAVQVFPNGTITGLANLSKQFAYAIVEVKIAYSENMDRVTGTLREVGASMERDAVWRSLILAPLEIVGIESLADGAATVRVKFKTQPLNQGKVGNELRRRLMSTLVGRGIKPFA